jgi:hypothetical protein
MAQLRPVTPVNLRAISAADVALSLVKAVKSRKRGTRILLSGELQRH